MSPVAKRIIFIAAFVSLSGLIWFYLHERKAIAAEKITAWLDDQRADCGVVLTGGPGRVREGFDLLAQGQIHKLIISGVHPRASLREIFPQWPYYGNLREEDVVLERRSTTTYGNAVQSLPLVEAVRCRSLVLITSHLHMRRAFKTFRRVFPAEILILTRSISSGSVPPRSMDLMQESFKSMFYSLWAY
jgi:uncharacterized SAM-binding protein YcdF (DUF218 family)